MRRRQGNTRVRRQAGGHRRGALLALALLLALLAAACGQSGTAGEAGGGATAGSGDATAAAGSEAAAGEETAAPIEGDNSVTLGTGIDATYAQIFVAVDAGILEDLRLDAQYQTFEAGGMSIEQAGAGTVDVGAAGELPGLAPFADGAPIRYVATGLTTGRSGGVGAAPGITEPSDLAGKRVAILEGSTSELYQTLFFQKHGLEGQAETVNVAPPEMIPALQSGQVQAMFVWEPWLTRLTETVDGASVPWRYGDDDVYTLHWGYWFNADFLEERREVAERTLQGLAAASDWIAENPDEAAQIVADATRSEVADIERQMADLDYEVRLSEEDVAHYRDKIIPFANAEGLIDVDDPEAFIEEFMYPDLLESVSTAGAG